MEEGHLGHPVVVNGGRRGLHMVERDQGLEIEETQDLRQTNELKKNTQMKKKMVYRVIDMIIRGKSPLESWGTTFLTD